MRGCWLSISPAPPAPTRSTAPKRAGRSAEAVARHPPACRARRLGRRAGSSHPRLSRVLRAATLLVSPETLEPRPDTETLVDAMLPHLRQIAARGGACRILDLGTGTGAIALALLAEVPRSRRPPASIFRADALATASRNARENGSRSASKPLQSDWFEKISGTFHVIVANPPYIPTEELETLQSEVRDHDPASSP